MNVAPASIAVTGSTGVLGGLVAGLLAAAGVPQRLLVRTLDRAPVLPGAVALPCSYADRNSSTAALTGAQTVLMVSASESADRVQQHHAFVDAACAAGVDHIIYTSFAGAAPDAMFTLGRDHFATEEYIVATGLRYTFLRDSFYLDFLPALVGDDGVIRGPAGQGRVAAVARDDIARVAAVVLCHPEEHRNATYELTGPEALSMAEVAQQISVARGTAVRYHDETVEEAYASRAKWGAPDWQVDAWVSTYTAIAAGGLERTTSDVELITGRAPTTLAQLLERTVHR